MLTDKSDYDYIDWSADALRSAEVDGTIMPMEDFMHQPHALRYEDFCYLWESMHQVMYGGRYEEFVSSVITPSVDAQKALKAGLGALSSYARTGYGIGSNTCLKPNSVAATSWFAFMQDPYTGLKQQIPEASMIDFSDIDIDPDETRIDDALMEKLYSTMEKIELYNSTPSFKAGGSSSTVPLLGTWSLTCAQVETYYKEDGQTVDRTSTTSWTYNKMTGGTQGAGIQYRDGVSQLMTRTMWNGTSKVFRKTYLQSSSLTVAVPKGTTECYVYITAQIDTTGIPACGKIYRAAVDTSTSTATITGFGTEDDIDQLVSLGNVRPNGNGVWSMFVSAVFCKVTDAKWHWW